MYNRDRDEDILLVQKSKKGDKDAFGELVRRYQSDLYQLARNLVSSTDEAEDITAETFVRAWRYIKSFKEKSSFKTWIWKILVNLSRTHLRRRYLQNKIFFWQGFFKDKDDHIKEIEWIDPSTESDPEKTFEQKNIQQVVRWARGRLSRREQEVFTLKYDKELKISEISEILSLSENTIKVLLFRATKKMAKELKDY